MARGFKIADAYVELTVDRDGLRRGVRGIPDAVGPDADKAGRDLGQRVTRGLEQRLEQLSTKLTRARREVGKATDAVTLAEKKLDEVRAKGNAKGSQILAAEQRLAQARLRVADANERVSATARERAKVESDLTRVVQDAARKAGPSAERGGDDLGDKLAVGMRMAIIRHSPLIAAAIAGVLLAGGPLLLGAASTLFAGIGIVAAAQAESVQRAWLGTWEVIKQGAIEDARVLVPTLELVARQVAHAFQMMRPELQGIFRDLIPQVETLATGLLGLARSALPGFALAISRADPVMRGFSDFLISTGAGLGEFFAILSDRSPEAGQAFTALGDIMHELLVILAELVSAGTGLATVALPALASALRIVADVLGLIEPVLPAIVLGFTALKVAQAAAGWVGTLAGKLAAFAASGSLGAGAAGNLAGALGRIGPVAGVAGAAIGGVALAAMAWYEAGRKTEEMQRLLGRALEVGGAQADGARRAILEASWATDLMNTSVGSAVGSFGLFGYKLRDFVPTVENSKRSYDEWVDSLTASEAAAENVRVKMAALEQAVADYGPTSRQAQEAARELSAAEEEQARVSEDLERAINGVTEAMIAQADQAMAAIDSSFAAQHAANRREDAEDRLAEAIRNRTNEDEDLRTTAEDVERATLDVEEALYREAQALAEATAAASDLEEGSADYNWLIKTELLRNLEAMQREAGPEMAAALGQMIQSLRDGGVTLDEVGTKAMNSAGDLDHLGGRRPRPAASLDDGSFSGTFSGLVGRLGYLARARVYSGAGLSTGGFDWNFSNLAGRLSWLARTQVFPSAILRASTGAAEWQLNHTARDRSSRVFQYVQTIGHVGGRATGGPVPDALPGLAGGGEIHGPGTPTSDSILGVDSRGRPRVRVSDDEWVIQAAAVRALEARFGPHAMATINAGRLPVEPVEPPALPGLAAGGRLDPGVPAAASSGGGSRTLTVQNMTVRVEGPVDVTDRRKLRRVAVVLRDELVKLEREQS